ncbi:hypothetical protein HU200_064747 [Digitaria exilis]|uniref:RING-type domain-containing protein n=1 Tax=Digitaria exilis TaxID=1010633 RepID=A0A835A1G8_9POAL|nr:hypothetical protein HU200_064747 [Digitaria exilis]
MEPQGKKKNVSSSSLIKSKVQSATIYLDTPSPLTTASGGEQPEFTVTLRCRVNRYTKGGPKLRRELAYRGGGAEASFVAGVGAGDVPRDEDGVRAMMRSLLRAIWPLRQLGLTDDEWEAILPEDVVPKVAAMARGGGAAVVKLEVDRHVRYSAPRVLLTVCREAAAPPAEEEGGGCSICYEPLREKKAATAAGGGAAVELPGCAHAFHGRCIRKWFSKKPTCPLCRGEVTKHLDPVLRMHLAVVF